MTELIQSSLSDLPVLVEISNTTSDSLLTAGYLEKAIMQGKVFSISVDQTIAGFIVEKTVGDEAELLQITLNPSFQKRGIGFQAMSAWHAQLRAASISDVFLEVRANNTAASSLYSKMNYNVVGQRKNYYRINDQSEDALLMKVTL